MTIATVATLGAAAKTILATLAMTAAQGALAALVAWAVIRACKLRASWQAALWLVVVAKLALPWGPAMPWSLSDLIASLSDRGAHALISAPASSEGAPVAAHLWPALGWLALAGVWMAGALVVVARAIARQRAAARVARTADNAPTDARALLAELAARAHVRPPRLAIGDAATGPYVLGVVRATIIVPPALLADRALLRAALLHELAHVRRKDALARAAQIWIGAVYFWLPVARVVGRRLDAAREAACDAWALAAGELPRASYARLLVRMAALHVPAPASAMAGAHTPKLLDARVAAVLAAPAAGRARLAHKLALAAWAVIILGGARTASARGHGGTCVFSPALAASLRLAHPEADLDGDGVLSPEEACELEAQLEKLAANGPTSPLAPAEGGELAALLAEPLGCKLPAGEGMSSPELTNVSLAPRLPAATCQQVEGADR